MRDPAEIRAAEALIADAMAADGWLLRTIELPSIDEHRIWRFPPAGKWFYGQHPPFARCPVACDRLKQWAAERREWGVPPELRAGLMLVRDGKLVEVAKPPRVADPDPMPTRFVASLVRAAWKAEQGDGAEFRGGGDA